MAGSIPDAYALYDEKKDWLERRARKHKGYMDDDLREEIKRMVLEVAYVWKPMPAIQFDSGLELAACDAPEHYARLMYAAHYGEDGEIDEDHEASKPLLDALPEIEQHLIDNYFSGKDKPHRKSGPYGLHAALAGND